MASLTFAILLCIRRLIATAFALLVFAFAVYAEPPAPIPTPAVDPLAIKLPGFPRPLVGADQPLSEKLRTPRDTLQTLYYSVDVYDYFPAIIQDAVACLDLADTMPADSASAALLAVQLESVLNSLDLPLAGVTDNPTTESITLAEGDDIKIVMRKYPDGLWRFDRATVEHIPAMRRTVLSRQKNLMAERATLKEGYTDPRTTIKRFWLDALAGDFTAASRALDLSSLSTSQRRELSPQLAQMLAFVLQRRGYTYTQLFSDNPTAPPFTWHADLDGRVIMQRQPTAEGKDAWLFNRSTVAQLPRMYAAAQNAQPDFRFKRLGLIVPPMSAETTVAGTTRPANVPERLGSPRMTLRTFFRAMDSAETNDSKINDALECLDLGAIPDKDRKGLGTTLAGKLEAILRALHLDLSAISDSWDSATQTLSDARGVKVELTRQQDGCWRISEGTVSRIPELFEKLAAKERADRERSGQFGSARDTTVSFLNSVSADDLASAARCLDLSDYFPTAEDELGPVLAYKLKYVLDRTGRIYIQEVPDDPEGPRYALYRGEVGRIVLSKRASDPRKGDWQFTPETVKRIEAMFRQVMRRPVDSSLLDAQELNQGPSFWSLPGVWLRLRLPDWTQMAVGPVDGYQWAGLGVAFLVSGFAASLLLGRLHCVVGFVLRQSGSALTTKFVAKKLRPLTWLAWVWLFFRVLSILDLPITSLDGVLALKKFVLAGLVAWFGFGLIDLIMAVYTNSELLRPHRSLSDMVVPVSMRFFKGCTIVLVLTYIVYQIGQGDMLGRFLTGLGVAGLAASLAAQDALKSFFGTLLLIGERSFKIGDRVNVDNKTEGTVEQVGFRSTRLRTKDGSLVTIPNSTFAAASINNFGVNQPEMARAA